MSTRPIGGKLNLTAMKALTALRRAEIVDVVEDRADRPVDRLDFLREARWLIEAGDRHRAADRSSEEAQGE